MSMRDLATSALCAPTGSSSNNPLAQLAEAALPSTLRPELAAPRAGAPPPPLTHAARALQQLHQHAPNEQELNAPALPTNLFAAPVPVPAPLPPIPAPAAGGPTDVFERTFRPAFEPTTTRVGPAPPSHMTHSYAPPSYQRRPARSSWRTDLNSSFSAFSLRSHPHHRHPLPQYNYAYNYAPAPQMVAQVAPPVTPARTDANSSSVASSSSDHPEEPRDEQQQRETEQVEDTAVREPQNDEDFANELAWNEQLAALSETLHDDSTPGTVNELLFDETMQSAFQHWLRRDASNAYRFSNRRRGVAASSNRRSASESLQLGIRAHTQGRLGAAVFHLEDALNRGNDENSAVRATDITSNTESTDQLPASKRALAWYVLGLCLADLDDDERAIQALTTGLSTYNGSQIGQRREDNPYLWQSLIALSVSFTNELEPSSALRSMTEWLAVRRSVSNADGEADIPSADTAEATSLTQEQVLAQLNEVAAQNPQDADVFIVLGILHNLNRDYDAAAIALRHAVALRPNVPNLWNKLGATLANGGNSDEALRAYRRAVDLQPALVRAWVNVGTAYSNRSEYAKAIRYYLKAITISRDTLEKDAVAQDAGAAGSDEGAGKMAHVWGYVRSSLISLSRPELLQFTDNRDIESLRSHFQF